MKRMAIVTHKHDNEILLQDLLNRYNLVSDKPEGIQLKVGQVLHYRPLGGTRKGRILVKILIK